MLTDFSVLLPPRPQLPALTDARQAELKALGGVSENGIKSTLRLWWRL